MTSTTRALARQELRRARNLIGWVALHLLRVYNDYRETHPEVAEPLGVCLAALDHMDTVIQQVHDNL